MLQPTFEVIPSQSIPTLPSTVITTSSTAIPHNELQASTEVAPIQELKSLPPIQPVTFRQRIAAKWFHFQTWFSFFYILEWLFTIAIILISLLLFGDTFDVIPINQRYGPLLGDPFVSFPLVEEIFPAPYLAIPIIGCVLIALLFNLLFLRSVHDAHHFCLGYAQALALSLFCTFVLKIIVGRPRPYFLAFCQPQPNLPANTIITNALCTNPSATSSDFRTARMSFPSAHASVGFTICLFLSYYIAGKLALFSIKFETLHILQRLPKFITESHGFHRFRYGFQQFLLYWTRETKPFWKMWIAFLPLLLACWIAVSRNIDYRHNVDDTIAGVLIGVFSATILYSYWFHTMTGTQCDLPRHHYWTKQRIVQFQREVMNA